MIYTLDRLYRPENDVDEWRVFEVEWVDPSIPSSGPLASIFTFLDAWRAGGKRRAIFERTSRGRLEKPRGSTTGSRVALVKWAHLNNRILGTIRKSYQKYWNEEAECISPNALRSMEQEKLARQLEYVYSNTSFYRSKFDQAGIHHSGIIHVEDLSRPPFTTNTADVHLVSPGTMPRTDMVKAPRIVRNYEKLNRTGKYIVR